MTNGDSDDNTTDLADNEMTKSDSTEASQNKAVEYVVGSNDDHGIVKGKTLYHVR